MANRNYELKAVFSADNKATKTIESLNRQLGVLSKKLAKLSKQEADPSADLHAEDFMKTADKVMGKMEEMDKGKAEPSVGLKGDKQMEATLDRMRKEFNALDSTKANPALGLTDKEFKAQLKTDKAMLADMAKSVTKVRVKAEAQGFSHVAAEARMTGGIVNKELNRVTKIIATIEGEEKVQREVEVTRAKLMAAVRKPYEFRLDGDNKRALTAIKEADLAADRAAANVRELKIKFEETGSAEVKAKIAEMEALVQQVSQNRAEVRAQLEGLPKVLFGLASIKKGAEIVEGVYEVKVEVAGSARATAALLGLSAVMKTLRRDFQAPGMENFAKSMYIVQQSVYAVTAALVALAVVAIGPLIAGLGILTASLASAAGGFGLMAAAVAPVISQLVNMKENQKAVQSAQSALNTSTKSLTSAQGQLADAQQNVGETARNGADAVKSAIQAHADSIRAVADARRSYKDAVQGVNDAEIQAEENVKSAIQAHADAVRQVADARRAYQDAVQGVGDAEVQAEEAVKAAIQAHADAVRQVADARRTYNEAVRGVGEAEQQAEEGVRSAIEAHESALRDIRSAQYDYQQAQQDAAQAQQALTDATRSYNDALSTEKFRLADMRDDIKGMQLSQEQLALEIKQAEEEMNDPKLSADERRAAEIRYQQLLLQRKQNLRDIKQAQMELNDAEKRGTDELQSAEQARKDAAQGAKDAAHQELEARRAVTDATKRAADAEKAIAKARSDGAKQVADAQRQVADAQRGIQDALRGERDAEQGINKARVDGAKQVADAQQQVADAQRGIRDAQRGEVQAEQAINKARVDGAKQVADAQKQVADAQRSIQDSLRGERQAEQDIAKARQDAAKANEDAQEQVKQAMQAVADAQEQVSLKQKALNLLLKPMTSDVKRAMDAVNNWKQAYKDAFASATHRTTELLIQIIKMSQRALPRLGEVADTTTRKVGEAFNRVAREFGNFHVPKSVDRILRTMPTITKNWSLAIGRFLGGLINMLGTAAPFARRLSRYIADAMRDFLRWTGSKRGREQLREFFESAAPVARALGHAVWRISAGLLGWSTKHADQVGEAIQFMTKWLIRGVKFAFAFGQFLWRGFTKPSVAMDLLKRILKSIWHFLQFVGDAWHKAFGGRSHQEVRGLLTALMALYVAMKLIPGVGLLVKLSLLGIWKTGKFVLRALLFQNVVTWAKIRAVAVASLQGIKGASLATSAVVGAAWILTGWFLVKAWKTAWGEITRTAPAVGRGLAKIAQNRGYDTGQKLAFGMKQAWLQAKASVWLTIVGSIHEMVADMFHALSKVPGAGKYFEKLANSIDKDVQQTYNNMRGKTNQMAEQMDKSSQKGSKDMSSNMSNAKDNTTDSMKKAAINTKLAMMNMKDSMVDNSKKGSDVGQDNLKAFMKGGSYSGDNLYKNFDASMKSLKDGTLNKTSDTKIKGIKDWSDFKTGGSKQSDLLKLAATKKMADMQNKVNDSTSTTKEKGIAALVELQERGTAAMSVAQEQWVNKAWDTSYQTQQSFNAILEGLAKFIDHANIDVDKPKQFSLIGRKGGNIAGDDTGGMTGAGGTVGKQARGNILKYAGGGQHPVGGVAQGTTRVYGEVPGTTEFYITDNPKFYNRNMDILMAANQHMLRMASGGVQRWDNVGGDKTLGVNIQTQFGSAVRNAMSKWDKLGGVNVTRGNDVTFRDGPAAGNAALTSSAGWTEFNPTIINRIGNKGVYAAMHEMGHNLRHGHVFGNIQSTMHVPGQRQSAPTEFDRKLHASMWGTSGAAGPQTQRNQIMMSNTEGAYAGHGVARAGNAYAGHGVAIAGSTQAGYRGSGGQRYSHSINLPKWVQRLTGIYYASGGIRPMKPYNYGGGAAHDMLARASEYAQGFARGGLYPSSPTARRGGEYRNLAGTTYNWVPWVQSIQSDVKDHIGGISANTYPDHGGRGFWGEQHSVDYWNAGGRGSPIGSGTGNRVVDYTLDKYRKDMMYYIWQGMIHGWGKTEHYPDASDQHFDHVHQTYDKGANLAGAGGGSMIDYGGMFDKYVPKMQRKLGYGLLGPAVRQRGNFLRDKIKDKYMNMTGGTMGGWAGGGTLDKWIEGGLKSSGAGGPIPGFEPSAQNIATYHKLAMMESGGNPNITQQVHDINSTMAGAGGFPDNRARGLLQDTPQTWEGLRNRYGADPGRANPNIFDPVKNTAIRARSQASAGYPAPRATAGAAFGGLALGATLGVVGDRGKELMWPLEDPRTTRAIMKAVDQTKPTRSMPGEPHGGNVHRTNDIFGANRGTKDVVDKLDEMKRELKEELRKEIDVSDDAAKKFMRAGAEMVLEMLREPKIGGKAVNKHIADDINFWKEM